VSLVVLDSSILLASVYPEMLTRQAQSLLIALQNSNTFFHAPILLRYEVVAVSRKAVHQRRISPEQGRVALNQLIRYPVTLHFDDLLLERAYELAEEFYRPTAYDSQYVALSERLNCDFWTADERLFNAIKSKYPSIHWLGNWV
jgi:predicted nucleic acid-binding protein